MKLKQIIILLLSAVSIGFTGCSKDDGPIKSAVSIIDVPAVSTSVDGTATIPLATANAFSGKFKAELYFTGATPPSKVDIVVRKNGSNGNVKVYKAGVNAFPASITFTGAELAALFGAALALNDTYDFAPDIYVGDRKFEAFPAVGVGTGAGPKAMPNFSEFARFTVK